MNSEKHKDLLLRKFVSRLLMCTRDRLLDEDEEYDADEQKEVSAGGVAGVTTPLGTGPHYPNPEPTKPKPAYVAAGDVFGGARPLKKKKKKKKKT